MTTRDMQAIKVAILQNVLLYAGGVLTVVQKGALMGMLERAVGVLGEDGLLHGGKYNRRLVLAWLFRYDYKSTCIVPLSSKELTEAEWYALHNWVSYYKDDSTGKWLPNDQFVMQAQSVLMGAKLAEDLHNQYTVTDPLFDNDSVTDYLVSKGGVVKPLPDLHNAF